MSDKIFVSYSRKDEEWAKRFQDALGGVYKTKFELSIDTKIAPSEEWPQRLDDFIQEAHIALLLVSPRFAQSSFIAENELPKILRLYRNGVMSIFWVPIERVPEQTLKALKLDVIQAAQPVATPLSKLNQEDLDQALLTIANSLSTHVDLHRKTSRALRDEVTGRVSEVLPDVELKEPFACGDHSIFYKAKREGLDIAVKALMPSTNQAWLGQDFIKRANVVREVTNSTAIGIRQVLDKPRVQCVVMDLISAPTLDARLQTEQKLDYRLVAEVLAQLARLADQLRCMNGAPIIGPVRPSHVHYDIAKNKVFISLMPLANETLDTCRKHPTLLMESHALWYLSPELYNGEAIDWRTDQYYLGLLALELLQGKPPVAVKTFSDLEAKARFFESPRLFFGEDLRRNCPALSFVLGRMLERNPQNRWDSMQKLVNALTQLAAGEVPAVVKQDADDQYSKTLGNNAMFFSSFYRILFGSSPEVQELFEKRGIKMEQQYDKLDKAMSSVLNFNREMTTSTLKSQVESHRAMSLSAQHFDMFRDAFLNALPDAEVSDDASRDAWRAILDPALAYMSEQVTSPQH